MSKFGKFLVGCTAAGLAAAGLVYVLDKSAKKTERSVDSLEEDTASSDFVKAVDRTYTTIRTGAENAYTAVKEKVGPKGEEVLNVMEDTVGGVIDVLSGSASKMKDVFKEPVHEAGEAAESLFNKAEVAAEDLADDAASAAEAFSAKAEDLVEDIQEKAEEAVSEIAEDKEEETGFFDEPDPVSDVEEFFDDRL